MISNSACLSPKASETAGSGKVLVSPADAEIERAKVAVDQKPDLPQSHLRLASAYLKKVRETGDYEINREAEKPIAKALEIEPESFDARILQTQIYLSEHKFAEALDLTKKLEKQNPSNSVVYAALTDALTELGKYEDAVKTAQKMVDFKPNSASYTRVAHLRSLYGDVEGAIEARKLALRIADPDDKEGVAWFYSELGKEFFNTGKFAEAEQNFDNALQILPNYHWALAGKGKVRAANGDLEMAADIYQKLYDKVPQTDRAIFLGDIYEKLGETEKASEIYNLVVKREKSKGENGDMHRVALYWADHDLNLDEALEIAKKDRETNGDLLASDTLAWCLYKKGNYAQAKKSIDEAMRLKSKNALFHYHKGMIEYALGNRLEAINNLKTSLEINPSFDIIQTKIAKETLEHLRTIS